jgi:hypothetical protein
MSVSAASKYELKNPVTHRAAELNVMPGTLGPDASCIPGPQRETTGGWKNVQRDAMCAEPDRPGSLPATTERVVDLNQREALAEFGLRKIELCGQIVVFTNQYLQVTRSAVLVENLRETVGVFRRRRQ